MRILTSYEWHTGKLSKPMQLAVVTDLHDAPYQDMWPQLDGADCLLVVGDLVNRYRQTYSRGVAFVNEAAERLPTFVSLGNHEYRLANLEEFVETLQRSKATFLLNTYAKFQEVWIGGWYRPHRLDMPDMAEEFEHLDGCKVMMCHHPEDYFKYLHGRDIDLVVAGHAHGGQFRLGGRGLYSPGQGLFPKYTKGVVDGRMIVSAGASNASWVPRINNPCEVLRIVLD